MALRRMIEINIPLFAITLLLLYRPAEAQPGPIAEKSGVSYVTISAPPVITDLKVDSVNYGLITSAISASQGISEVDKSTIANPANIISQRIAMSYAAKEGLAFIQKPLDGQLSPHLFQANTLKTKSSERYAVESTFTLIQINYAPLNWYSYDVSLTNTVYIFDTITGVAVTKARCHVLGDHSAGFSRNQLLENSNFVLHKILSERVNQCVSQLDGKLGLQDIANGSEVSATSSIGADKDVCEPDKERAAERLGLPCSALKARLVPIPTDLPHP